MDEKQLKRWEQFQKKGFWRYLIVYGVLMWGGVAGVFYSAFILITNGKLETRDLITVAMFSVGGILYGSLSWDYFQRAYQKAKMNIR
jgi:hypothetical protein